MLIFELGLKVDEIFQEIGQKMVCVGLKRGGCFLKLVFEIKLNNG